MAEIVFVHGIGRHPRPTKTLESWRAALINGMRMAGHDDLAEDPALTCSLAHYSDLFTAPGSQGSSRVDIDPVEFGLALHLLELFGERLIVDDPSAETRNEVGSAMLKLRPTEDRQGAGLLVKWLVDAVTTLMNVPVIRSLSRWPTAELMVGDLRQVSRYMARREPDQSGVALDSRIRARVAEQIDGGTVAVVAHSLGSVVAFEALHELNAQLPVFVTLGSPLALRSVVYPRLAPPRTTPPNVGRWINFWDKDDIIAIRPGFQRDFGPNGRGVEPESVRTDTLGMWTHGATGYLAQPALAGAIARVLRISR